MCSPSSECGSCTSPLTARFTRSSRSSRRGGRRRTELGGGLLHALGEVTFVEREAKLPVLEHVVGAGLVVSASGRVHNQGGPAGRAGVAIISPIPSPASLQRGFAAGGDFPRSRPYRAWTSRARLLLVEDDEATRPSCRQPRRGRLPGVPARPSADEALRAIEARQPALLLLDLRLEGRQRARAARPGAGGRRHRHPGRPRVARDRAHRPLRGGRPGAQLRPRGRRPPLQAVPLCRAARPRPRAAAAGGGPARGAAC